MYTEKSLDELLDREGLQSQQQDQGSDGFTIVAWKADSPSHPRNWGWTRRIFDGSIMFFLQFFTTVMATAGVSLGLAAQEEFGITRLVTIVTFALTYQLGRIVGTLTLPPYTESFGRKPTFIASSFIYSVACLLCGVVPGISGVIVGRILSGAASTVGGAVAAGAVQDMYATEHRVWAVFLWTATAVAGLTVGPIYGSYLAQAVSWRWAFYIAAIIMFGVGCMCCLTRENRASRIRQEHVLRIRKCTGREDIVCKGSTAPPSLSVFLRKHLALPVFLLTTEPIVVVVTTLSAVAWSLLFLFTESLSVVFGLYGFTDAQCSLFFIPILIGVFGGIPLRLYDYRRLRRKSASSELLNPEDKLMGFAIAAPTLAVGLWWFAWTTPQAVETHWIVPSLALVLVGFAINEFEYALAGYLADCYGSHASSAIAAMSVVRSAFAGALPLFAYYMFTGISTNAASSILAAMATVFCTVPIVFAKYGAKLRERSAFARTNATPME